MLFHVQFNPVRKGALPLRGRLVLSPTQLIKEAEGSGEAESEGLREITETEEKSVRENQRELLRMA